MCLSILLLTLSIAFLLYFLLFDYFLNEVITIFLDHKCSFLRNNRSLRNNSYSYIRLRNLKFKRREFSERLKVYYGLASLFLKKINVKYDGEATIMIKPCTKGYKFLNFI